MANTTFQLSCPRCSTGAVQKTLTLNKQYFRICLVKGPENRLLAETNDKTERVRGLGRKTREKIGRIKQMTALRFKTGGEGGGGGISHPGLLSGDTGVERIPNPESVQKVDWKRTTLPPLLRRLEPANFRSPSHLFDL